MARKIPDDVRSVIESYPAFAAKRIRALRQLVLKTASEVGTADIEETLKWGEPSFVTKRGSTLRLAYDARRPEQCSLYFICNTRLVETFREVYPDVFEYDGKRAIHLPVDGPYNESALAHCIAMTLTYHDVKHMPLLGA